MNKNLVTKANLVTKMVNKNDFGDQKLLGDQKSCFCDHFGDQNLIFGDQNLHFGDIPPKMLHFQ